MKRMALILTAALAVVAVSPATFAADARRPVYKAPPAVPATPGATGFYVGLNGGYGWGRTSLSDAGGANDVHVYGWMVGPTVGYNAQLGSFVYGFEGDIDYSWIKGQNGATGPCAGCEVRDRYLATVRARLGYAVGKALPFITGGLAVGELRISTPTGTTQSNTRAGWTIGGGLEYDLLASWSAKIEYLYVDLARASCSAAVCGTAVDEKFRANLVRLGVNYRF